MSGHEQTIRRYWQCAEERDWSGFAEVLSPDVVYDMSQTRERVIGRDAYVRFNQEYPGDWHLALRRVVADDRGATSWLDVTVGGETMTGITFFTFDDDGLVTAVDDFWPEPYDPPAGRPQVVERY
ncbi:nuclear transport factor 2 family protein [uncultured Nocardioides sp.]|uniref:nuclear transport factor 2 family protein n=1 Tax=uncultured Nocardioides sp. TaxID=198441 RepID=UPI0025E3639D|nr:nuclear transport factor 2 family protein [uncultured Nocardioides sp.]